MRILVVEDDKDVANFIVKGLKGGQLRIGGVERSGPLCRRDQDGVALGGGKPSELCRGPDTRDDS